MRLIHLPDGHSAERLHVALGLILQDLPDAVRWTLTSDQGSEMAHHRLLADRFREGVFFAHPASPWQRPTNENTNGCYASTSPKAPTSPCTMRPPSVEERLNHRPRKILNWSTPVEIFAPRSAIM